MYLSTFNTDLILLQEDELDQAVRVLMDHFAADTGGGSSATSASAAAAAAATASAAAAAASPLGQSPLMAAGFDATAHMHLSIASHDVYLANMAKHHKQHACHALLRALFFAAKAPFASYIQTQDDISLILSADALAQFPSDVVVVHERAWRCVQVSKGMIPFADSALVSMLALALARDEVPIYYHSTFNT